MSAFVTLTEAREAASAVYEGVGIVPFGWEIDPTFGDGGAREGPGGGYVYALKPAGVDDGRRMLVFRGTEVTLTNVKDVFADVTDIGRTQFEELGVGANGVNQWLAQELVAGRQVELVGHSSGGALVQWAINDTNIKGDNQENNATVFSVLEHARSISGDDNFQINPNQLHFTTFNSPGITHVLGGTTPTTDRTSIVVGEHHVVIGDPPLLQGDLVHLLGGPHVGGAGTQLVGHQVDFADFRDGLFTHTIDKPEYWTAPVVAYTPLQLDLALTQSFANHYAQLGNTDGTVEGDAEAMFRLTLYASSLGIALSVGEFAKQAEAAAQLARLQFDRDVFANTLALPGIGINQALDMIARAADAAGLDVVQIQEVVSSSLIAVGEAILGAVGAVESFVTDTLVAWITNTAHGIGNAVTDFLHEVAGAFDLGRSLNFNDVNLIAQAYAAELNDLGLSPSIRTAIEQAQQIVQLAGQTVVIQKGLGPNPFDTSGYVPGGASSATVEEKLGELFRVSLPFAAGTGGQRISLHLQGPQADQLSVATDDGAQAIGADGTFELIVPEGADQVLFTLIASDEVSADATVTLSATLVDAMGEATHTTQMESVVSVKAFVGNTDDRYEEYTEDWSRITDPSVGVLMGVGGFFHQTLIGGAGADFAVVFPAAHGDDTIYGNGGDDVLSSGRGHDVLYGGEGDDILRGDHVDDVVVSLWEGPGPDPRGTQDGKDYVDGGAGNDILGGGGGDDRLIGGSGDDVLWGDAYTNGYVIQHQDGSATPISLTGVLHPGNDVLEGGDGNDRLSGDGGDDTLDGGAGHDLLIGDTQRGLDLIYFMAPGDDYLVGGDGNDELQGNAGDDVLLGGAGDDLLFGDDEDADASQEGDDWLDGGDGADQLVGQGGNDTLIGGAGADVFWGGAGNDTLMGGDGDDAGYGSEGDDEIVAGAGADWFDGEDGDDVMFGEEGDDFLIGGGGQDTIFGGEGTDELQGGRGNDVLVGEAGDDQIFGQEDHDELFGGDGNDGLRGDDGDDALDGGAGDDILVGDTDGQIGGAGGNDILIGGTGNDVLIGGGGQDTYLFALGDGFDVIIEAAGEENRLVFGAGISPSTIVVAVGPDDSLVIRTGSGEDAVQIQNFGTNNLNGPHPIDSFQFSDGTSLIYSQLAAAGLAVSGGLGNDHLVSTAQGDRIYGGGGSDVINAGAGNDIVFGGTGNDTLFGGTENDTLYGQGDDDFLFGEDGDDVLVAAIGNDALFGGIGNDTLLGGAGIDYLEGGAGNDTIYAGAGDDLSFGDHNPVTAPPNETLVIGGDDYLDGEEGNDDLRGGAGNDILIGGLGNDLLFGGDGDDVLRGGVGNDTLRGELGVDVLYGEAGNDNLYAGSRAAGGGGGEGGGSGGGGFFAFFSVAQPVDQLYGDDGDDYLNSGNEFFETSDSLLTGGGGNDTFVIDSAEDTVIEERNGGIDTVETFVSYILPDHVENLTFAGLPGLVGTGNALDNVMRGLGQGTLDGRAGNDTLIDAQTYLFGQGDGYDTILENDPSSAPYFPGGLQDTISMAADIAPADVGWQRSGNDLVLTINGTTDQVIIPSYFTVVFNQGDYRFSPNLYLPGTININISSLPYYVAPSQIEQVQFADGTVWRAGTFGATQLGSYESNNYEFGRGDGQDTIVDFDFTLEQATDILQMNASVSPNEVTVRRIGDNLVLGITGTMDELTIQSHFASVFVLPPFATIGRTVSAYQLDQVRFADGTVWDAAMIASLIPIIGTDQNDVLQGTGLDNVLRGLGSHDTLQGLAGNDRIEGGPGNDTLVGGAGYDTYLFNLGEGIDTIEDVATPGEGNRIQFGAGILHHDLTFIRDDVARTLTIQVGASGTDQLVLMNFDPTGTNGSLVVETLVFVDGSAVNLVDLYPPNQAPTVANPLADQTVPEGVPVDIQVPYDSFADPDAGDTLTYSVGLASGAMLPAWLSFDVITRIFSGTADDEQVGSLDVRVTATDTGNLSVSEVFTLTVANVNEAPTAAMPLADQTAVEDAVFSFTVPAAAIVDVDHVHGDILTYSATRADGTALPTWLNFDPLTRRFSGTPLNGDVGTLTLTVTATDQGDLSASTRFDLTVHNVNDAPTVAMPIVDLTGAEDEPFSFTMPADTFADDDALHGDVLSSRWSLADGSPLPTWLSFDPITGTFSGTPIPGSAGTLQLTVTATDRGSLSVSDDVTLTIFGPLQKIVSGTEGDDVLTGARGDDTLSGLAGNDFLQGGEGHDQLDGGPGADMMAGGIGNDTYVVENVFDVVTEALNEGTDTVESTLPAYALGANVENLTLTGARPSAGIGNALNNTIFGNDGANLLFGGNGNDVLQGGAGSDALDGGAGGDTLIGGIGNDVLVGGTGNDLYRFSRGDGQDIIRDKDATVGNHDRLAFGETINPLDLVIERQANDLRVRIHHTNEAVLIGSWYSAGTTNHIETIQAGNGEVLLNTQVDQLIQAMAAFTQQTGLTWDHAIEQQPAQVQAVLAASWQ
jgi:Ca2+-binding RTX toxin-like protein